MLKSQKNERGMWTIFEVFDSRRSTHPKTKSSVEFWQGCVQHFGGAKQFCKTLVAMNCWASHVGMGKTHLTAMCISACVCVRVRVRVCVCAMCVCKYTHTLMCIYIYTLYMCVIYIIYDVICVICVCLYIHIYIYIHTKEMQASSFEVARIWYPASIQKCFKSLGQKEWIFSWWFFLASIKHDS